MKIKEITDYISQMFPLEYQENYDNSGFLVGDGQRECTGVLVALDLTESVIDEAETHGLNLIVTHHPLIFRGVKNITDADVTGRLIIRLIHSGISAYAAHTNLDNAMQGTNGALADLLDLTDRHILRPLPGQTGIGAGIVGNLPTPISTGALLPWLKKKLNAKILRTCKYDSNRAIGRVAVCSGSGAFLIDDAVAAGADLFLTADVKYHDFQHAEGRLLLVDAGHYETEQFAKDIFFCAISEKFRNFACRISTNGDNPVCYI